MRKPVYAICEQQRRRSGCCASAQTDQRLCCSLPRQCNTSSFYIRNFKPLASFCGCAGRFESTLVGNPEDRFTRDRAHLMPFLVFVFLSRFVVWSVPILVFAFSSTFQLQDVYEPPRDKTNKMPVRPTKTQISLGDSDQPGHPPRLIRVFAVCSMVAKDPSFLHTDSEDSDQTGRMARLI